MRAAVYRKERGGLSVEELPRPEPGPGEVRIRVGFAGICGSDLFLVRSGQLPDGTVLGHEMSGEVDGLGEGVKGVGLGRKVIVRPVGCGDCLACLVKQENLCPKRTAVGLGGLPGAYAEWLAVPSSLLIPLPDGLGLEEAALAEPLATALHAVRLGDVGNSDRVLVLGGGGIGMACVAVLAGLGVSRILVSEPQPGRRERVLALGAQLAVDPLEEDLPEAVRAWSGGVGPSVVLECAGRVEAAEAALRLAPPGGRVVIVGLAHGTFPFAPALVMLKQLRIQGSFANTRAECRECLDLLAGGRVRVSPMVEERISLEALPQTFQSLMEKPVGGKILVKVA